MNVTLNKTDSVNATISVEVVKNDYIKEVDDSLKDLRKNAVIPGFRKGMVPPSFLRQKYFKSILVEELNKLVSKNLSGYINDNDISILGEPLPVKEQELIDFDKQEDFTFTFDVGLSPEINVKISKEDIVPYYILQSSEEMIDKQVEHIRSQYGDYAEVEVIEENDIVKGKLIEVDEKGEPVENGIIVESASLLPKYIKNEEEKAKILNAKLNSTIIFNPYSAYDGNEAELSSFLKIEKEKVNNHKNDFTFEIDEISSFKAAEINQDLFDKAFGQGTIDSEETFRNKIKESIAQQLTPQSDYKFFIDTIKYLEERASGLQFPDEFLKRWLLASDENKTPESVEEDYPKIIKDLTIHIIKELLIKENNITIEESELQEYARRVTRAQFAQYGMYDIPDETVEQYSQDMLKKKESYRSLGDKIFEDKLMKVLKEQITMESKEISIEEFKELIK